MSITDTLRNALGSTPDTTPDASNLLLDEDAQPLVDDLHYVLSNARRRFVVSSVHHAGEAVSKADLASELARLEAAEDDGMTAGERRKATLVALHQAHLPALADADVVEYDGRDEVAPGPRLGLYFTVLCDVQEAADRYAAGGGL